MKTFGLRVDGAPPSWKVEKTRVKEKLIAVAVRSYLQVHQLELESLGQQIRENKRNGRLVRTSPASGGFFG